MNVDRKVLETELPLLKGQNRSGIVFVSKVIINIKIQNYQKQGFIYFLVSHLF